MKNLKDYLNEGLISRKVSTKTPIRYRPKDWTELYEIIVELLKKGVTDLNCIDVSSITSLSSLFWNVNLDITVKEIDISEWDVSNVTNMSFMFNECTKFNADLSKWNVSNVTNMACMFNRCNEFNSDLSKWNVSNINKMTSMFDGCENFNSDLSHWNVSKVNFMGSMFEGCKKFNSDLSHWDVSNVKNTEDTFKGCTILIKNNKIPDWYKGRV